MRKFKIKKLNIQLNIRLLIMIISGITFLACTIYIANYYYGRHKSREINNELIKQMEQMELAYNEQQNTNDPIDEITEDERYHYSNYYVDRKGPTIVTYPTMLPKFQRLFYENTDLIGWITIEDTNINYPIMQTKARNEYYLRRNFYKKYDIAGLPFLDRKSDVYKPTSNFFIYGHNMDDGTMFRDVLKYKKYDYYQNHKIIQFDTLYEKGEYEIIAVFLSKIYTVEDDVFKYYQFFDAKSEEEYNDFVDNVKALSLYDTGITAEYGDQLLTLSTCEYSTEDGRMAIVAKKIIKTPEDRK